MRRGIECLEHGFQRALHVCIHIRVGALIARARSATDRHTGILLCGNSPESHSSGDLDLMCEKCIETLMPIWAKLDVNLAPSEIRPVAPDGGGEDTGNSGLSRCPEGSDRK